MLLADLNESCSQSRQHNCVCLPSDWQSNQQPQHHIGVYQLSTIAVTSLSGLLRFCILTRLQVISLFSVIHEKPCFRLPLCLTLGTLETTLSNLLWEHSTKYLFMFQKFSLFYLKTCGFVGKFLPKGSNNRKQFKYLTVQYNGLSIGSIYPFQSSNFSVQRRKQNTQFRCELPEMGAITAGSALEPRSTISWPTLLISCIDCLTRSMLS